MISPLFVALSFIDGLLLLLLIQPRRLPWWIKLFTMVVVVLFNFVLIGYQAIGRGWPVGTTTVPTGDLVWCSVDEPDGIVYLWVIPARRSTSYLDYASQPYEPRAYALAYAPDLHASCLAAQGAIKHGAHVGVRAGSRLHSRGRGHAVPRQNIHFYLLPPPVSRRKEHP